MENICVTCLKKTSTLKKVNLTNTGSYYEAMVCVFCWKSITKIYAFQKQCARGLQLLQEYKCNGYSTKGWMEYCEDKNIKEDGLLSIGISETLCLDVEKAQDSLPRNHYVEYVFQEEHHVKEEVVTEQKHIHDELKEIQDNDIIQEGCIEYSSEEEMVNETEDKDKEDKQEEVDAFKIVNNISLEEQMADMNRRKEEKEYLDAKYKCELCYFGFKFQEELDIHNKNKHNEDIGIFKCWLCHWRFSSRHRLGEHTRCYHSRKLSCGICNKIFYRPWLLRTHIANHNGIYHTCDVCSKQFLSKGNLINHINNVHNQKIKVKCQYCGKQFKTKESYNTHQKTVHNNDRPFKCSDCPSAFHALSSLKVHILSRHRPPSEDNYCVECNIYLRSAAAYMHHQNSRKHADPELFIFGCSKCSRKYKTEEDLSRHITAMHDRVLQYSCTLCPAKYATVHGLNAHKRKVHKGKVLEKKYLCPYCDKGFTTKATKENHIRTHTGEQPFQCKECGRKFSQSSSLRTHNKLVHLKNKNTS